MLFRSPTKASYVPEHITKKHRQWSMPTYAVQPLQQRAQKFWLPIRLFKYALEQLHPDMLKNCNYNRLSREFFMQQFDQQENDLMAFMNKVTETWASELPETNLNTYTKSDMWGQAKQADIFVQTKKLFKQNFWLAATSICSNFAFDFARALLDRSHATRAFFCLHLLYAVSSRQIGRAHV